MTEYPTGPTTKRLIRRVAPRRPAFVRVRATAGEVLDSVPPDAEVVYLCGPRPPEGWPAWALTELGDRWEPGAHYLEAAAPVLRYTSAAGRAVEIQAASQWFGAVTADEAPSCARAWALLAQLVARCFPGGILWNTPAATGRDLFLRSIPEGVEWPVCSEEVQQLVRSTSGQGRVEVLAPQAPELPGLYEYDGRLMYAALCWGLPAGEPTRDTSDEYAGYQRGRYEVSARVPSDWGEPFGLLGVKDDGGGWRYPAEPGETFRTWCDGAELMLPFQHGWGVTIHERLLWPEYRGKGPLDTWAVKLAELRRHAGLQGGPSEPYLMAALRAIILHGIGAFHGRDHLVTRALPLERSREVPADAVGARVEGDWVLWGERTGQGWAALAHPEWSAAIWARARARLLRGPGMVGALCRAAGSEVVAFRTDALYMTGPQTWPDNGREGRLRLVRRLDGPAPWPASNAQLLALRGRMADVRHG